MIECAKYLVKLGMNPFVLIHESSNNNSSDYSIAEEISVAAGGIPIINELNPLRIKGILGACYATIGSRFHGIVSALSQGVPTLATGWSHKYEKLFEDYLFDEGLMSIDDDWAVVSGKIDSLIDPLENNRIRLKLLDQSRLLKIESEKMWDLVFQIIDPVAEARGKIKIF